MPNSNNNSVQDKFITLGNLEHYNDYVYPEEMTWDEYQEIEPEAGKTYFITDYDAGQSAEAVDVAYDNTSSELQADNVQDAIDELKDLVDQSGGTDTTYTLSVGTGADANKIVLTPSSGNPDKVTVPYATNAGTVNGKTVAENVPSGAVFTDTTDASSITYSNTTSGLSATKVQDAIDELASEKKDEYTTITYQQWQQLTPTQQAEKDYYISDYPSSQITAGNVSYSNTTSGMSANNVQGAVDELKSGLNNVDSEIQMHVRKGGGRAWPGTTLTFSVIGADTARAWHFVAIVGNNTGGGSAQEGYIVCPYDATAVIWNKSGNWTAAYSNNTLTITLPYSAYWVYRLERAATIDG